MAANHDETRLRDLLRAAEKRIEDLQQEILVHEQNNRLLMEAQMAEAEQIVQLTEQIWSLEEALVTAGAEKEQILDNLYRLRQSVESIQRQINDTLEAARNNANRLELAARFTKCPTRTKKYGRNRRNSSRSFGPKPKCSLANSKHQKCKGPPPGGEAALLEQVGGDKAYCLSFRTWSLSSSRLSENRLLTVSKASVLDLETISASSRMLPRAVSKATLTTSACLATASCGVPHGGNVFQVALHFFEGLLKDFSLTLEHGLDTFESQLVGFSQSFEVLALSFQNRSRIDGRNLKVGHRFVEFSHHFARIKVAHDLRSVETAHEFGRIEIKHVVHTVRLFCHWIAPQNLAPFGPHLAQR